ncbi:hypothetical protein L9F63_003266, partial [Diploptera punctata]
SIPMLYRMINSYAYYRGTNALLIYLYRMAILVATDTYLIFLEISVFMIHLQLYRIVILVAIETYLIFRENSVFMIHLQLYRSIPMLYRMLYRMVILINSYVSEKINPYGCFSYTEGTNAFVLMIHLQLYRMLYRMVILINSYASVILSDQFLCYTQMLYRIVYRMLYRMVILLYRMVILVDQFLCRYRYIPHLYRMINSY